MLSGREYLESLRDGRRVLLGDEVVEDVTTHPAFRNAASTFAQVYDRRTSPEFRDLMVCKEDGEQFATYFLQPRSRADLERRYETHRLIASWTHGFMGRSPDNFPSYLAGLATLPGLFNELRPGSGDNLSAYYLNARRRDLFVSHTVTNPQATRRAEGEFGDAGSPTLRVVAEDHGGVTINGLKMIGTASVFCHETWVGNLQPVPPGQEAESITCAVPLNAPGVSIWSRKSYERAAPTEFDAPMSWRYDESDAALLFENVKVPWERVFLHNNTEMSREIYMRTSGHSLANHQANVRFLEKLKLIVAIAYKLSVSNRTVDIPAVRSVLGKLAARLALLEGLIKGQIHSYEEMPAGSGFVTVNRRYMYAALHWCSVNHSEICDIVRELMGAGPIQMPADSSIAVSPELKGKFDTYWSMAGQSATERMKLIRLAWDILGSEFAGRHALYEKFYAGPGFVMDGYSYFACPWEELDAMVESLLSGYDLGAPKEL